MAARYEIPLISNTGYPHNLIEKIRLKVGRDWQTSSISSGNFPDTGKTVFRFDPPLDATEEAAFLALVADPETAQQPLLELISQTLVVKDLYEYRHEFETAEGWPIEVWFRRSSPEIHRADQLCITAIGRGDLSNQDKKAIVDWVKDLITGWV